MAMTPNPPPPEMLGRPRCPNCDKRLRPVMTCDWVRIHDREGFHTERRNYRWDGTYHGYGAFCTTACCVKFANAAHRAGYRRQARAA